MPNNSSEQLATIVIAGDILSTNAEDTRKRIFADLGGLNAADALVVDIRKAAMVDSVGLNLLVSVIKYVKARGGSVRFLIGSNNVERTLRFTRLDSQAELLRV